MKLLKFATNFRISTFGSFAQNTPPKSQLPHCIFFEDVDESGEPEFRKARLIDINRENQSCHIEYKDGSRDEIFLSAIELDWLHVLAECHLEYPD